MTAASAARSTSVTKSLCRFRVTDSRSTSRAARLMIAPARRAALTAIPSIGCMVLRPGKERCCRAPDSIMKVGARIVDQFTKVSDNTRPTWKTDAYPNPRRHRLRVRPRSRGALDLGSHHLLPRIPRPAHPQAGPCLLAREVALAWEIHVALLPISYRD